MQNLFNNNLVLRLLTALIAIPLVLILIIKTSDKAFLNISLLIMCFCSSEWSRLVKLKSALAWMFVATNVFVVYFLSDLLLMSNAVIDNYFLLSVIILWFCLALSVVVYNLKPYQIAKINLVVFVFSFILGAFIITPGFICLNYLKTVNANGYLFIIFLLILVWAIDTGSYFSGRLFGKYKLIPNVSPGKTIEGAIGGLFFLCISAQILYYNFSILNNAASLKSWLLISLAIYFAAITGDLAISMFKRIVAVKDTGTILPGHGGILDRLDSFFCAMPLFCYCLLWFRIIQ